MKLACLITLSLFLALLAPPALASPKPPLQPGEKLNYSVSWAIVMGAGEIVVSAENANNQLKITTTTATRRLARMLLKFNAVSESYYDLKTGRLVSLYERSTTREKNSEHVVTFDYGTRKAAFAQLGATTSRFMDMPDGSPSDLISALLETRSWDVKPGDKRDVLVLFKDEFYELTIHAIRYEEVSTPLGRFKTLLLEPRMEKTPPKGMFRRGSTVKVWIAQDERRLPVKFEVEFNIGTGTATLESYTPPKKQASVPGSETSAEAGTTPAPSNAQNSRP